MEKDPMFNPIVLVCPVVNRGRDHMLETMEKCCRSFEKKGYNYVRTYDEKTDTYVDAHSYNPDIIFYTNPYEGLIDDRYYLNQFEDALTCYVNYGYINVHMEWAVNLPFHQKVWRYYVECEDNLNLIKKYSLIGAKNVSVVGYPMYDAFKEGTANGDTWKVKNRKLKRVIWSPHHTVSNNSSDIRLSTFELYSDLMLDLAEKYKDEVQFVFKPHPLLKNALYNLDGWGKERTEAYYEAWANGENTAIADGGYVDLFNTSDAMINDSASFTFEYLYMNKPCLFLSNYDRQKDANEAALKAFESWYHATTDAEIENFIKDVLIAGNDSMKDKRIAFYNDVLLPPNGCSVAENIINDIKKALNK
jgi:CDP-glycerol glycerophosphotransferase (TagB/SpsB family)